MKNYEHRHEDIPVYVIELNPYIQHKPPKEIFRRFQSVKKLYERLRFW